MPRIMKLDRLIDHDLQSTPIDFQYEYKLGNDGLSILSVFGI